MLPSPGPPRITLTITPGTSAQHIAEIDSCISAIPQEDDEVIAFVPVVPAPITMLMEASSLSAVINTLPSFGRCFPMYSPISLWGVIG